jgi:hypothetical protein
MRGLSQATGATSNFTCDFRHHLPPMGNFDGAKWGCWQKLLRIQRGVRRALTARCEDDHASASERRAIIRAPAGRLRKVNTPAM